MGKMGAHLREHMLVYVQLLRAWSRKKQYTPAHPNVPCLAEFAVDGSKVITPQPPGTPRAKFSIDWQAEYRESIEAYYTEFLGYTPDANAGDVTHLVPNRKQPPLPKFKIILNVLNAHRIKAGVDPFPID